jgi:WD40 repeat protein
LFGRHERFARIANHLAATVPHTADDADELRMGIAGILLNGSRIVSAGVDGTFRLWDAKNSRSICEPLRCIL